MSFVDDEVIKNDYCIGCGGCAFLEPKKYEISTDKYEMLKATIVDATYPGGSDVDRICPFSPRSKNETEIADRLFSKVSNKGTHIGYYHKNYVGSVNEGSFRELGSSGGVGKWILYKLLEMNLVDYVIQIEPSESDNKLFSYAVFSNKKDVLRGAKSAYYPVTLYEALNHIKGINGRYAVTAIPCFAKTLRNLMEVDEILSERIVYIIGIICGHLKSGAFAESLAWQMGISPGNLKEIDFRQKIPGKKANDKGVIATDRAGNQSKVRSSKELFGGNWGHNLFKYKACDYCDDVIAETADIAIGDAWLPGYMDDHLGASVVVVRDLDLANVIDSSITDNLLNFVEVSPEKVVESQLGGIRHRTEGLSLRMHDAQENCVWTPVKRVPASNAMAPERKRIYRMRVKLRDVSHSAFYEAKNSDDYQIFFKKVSFYTARLSGKSWVYRATKSIVNYLKSKAKL